MAGGGGWGKSGPGSYDLLMSACKFSFSRRISVKRASWNSLLGLPQAARPDFTSGDLSHGVTVPAGYYAVGFKFVDTATGQGTEPYCPGRTELVWVLWK